MTENRTVYSFEEGVPDCFAATIPGSLAVSEKRFKDGRFALRWDRVQGAELKVSAPIGFQPYRDNPFNQARDTFAVWIYNERPVNDKLVFRFGRGSQQADCFFDFHLGFQGWRTAWVMFERDMQGAPHPDMDTLIVAGPEVENPGTLYFDQMVLSVPVDPRHHTRDEQVPFVNMRADAGANNHWMSLYRYSLLRCSYSDAPDANDEDPVIDSIKEKFEEWIWSRRKRKDNSSDLPTLREEFAAYRIVREDGRITGRPVLLIHGHEIFPEPGKQELRQLTNAVNVREYTEWMLKTAFAYRAAENDGERDELGNMFADALDHWLDQGWASGSGLGTVHHLGYNIQSLYTAVFLMREALALRDTHLMERTRKAMHWFSGTGRIFMDEDEIEGNIDIFNTTIAGMLASILLMKQGEEQAVALHAFSRWLSQSLRPAPGLRAALKVDGSVYHHVNHYPAYAVGGLNGVTPIVYFLSGTPYRIAEDAHAALRKALLTMRLYCNKYEWLVSLSARHPTGKGALPLSPYKYMTLAGPPDGSEAIDREMASAYMRLLPEGADQSTRSILQQAGIEREQAPSGHWSMNYAALGIHRRDDWLAGVRGHSRYLWANETYVDCNLYGRYISYGHLQIMAGGDPVNHADSGYVPEGWDWNRWPGTTTAHLPWEKLCSDVRNVDTWSGFEEMLLSDEAYCGSVHLESRNGMFAMKLHGHPKYDGSHRARKSFFFFENRIVALGTGIENTSEYATETTLFQNRLQDCAEPIWIGGETGDAGNVRDAGEVSEFPHFTVRKSEKPMWLIDNQGNGFYIPHGQTVAVSRKKQHSKHQKNRSDTEGDFAAAWLEHGVSPQGESYEYALVVQTDLEHMRLFAERMAAHTDAAPYTVLQKDRTAHIVRDLESLTTAYALFEANQRIAGTYLEETDTPCMVMIREAGAGRLSMSAVDPDLRLYEGVDASQYDEHGIQKEVSVYSRKWVHAASKPHRMTLTIRGTWIVAEASESVSVLAYQEGRTILSVPCKDAMPVEIVLAARDDSQA